MKSNKENEETMEKKLGTAKEWIFSIKERAYKAHAEMKSTAKEKQKDRKLKLEQRQKKIKEQVEHDKNEVRKRKEALEASIENFLVDHSPAAAYKKAENSEAYASACIAYAFSVIEEAQTAVQNAIQAKEQADQMESK